VEGFPVSMKDVRIKRVHEVYWLVIQNQKWQRIQELKIITIWWSVRLLYEQL
jgi:hypothetical protein